MVTSSSMTRMRPLPPSGTASATGAAAKGLLGGGEVDEKGRLDALLGFDREVAVVLGDDGVRGGQPEPSAARFRREVGVKRFWEGPRRGCPRRGRAP